MMKADEFHRQYDSLLSGFRRQLPDAGLRIKFGQEADAFFRECALQLWSKRNGSPSPEHADFYNSIYMHGNRPGSTLFWELVGLVGQPTDFTAPNFFLRMCQYDNQTGHSTARRFIRTFSQVTSLLATAGDAVNPLTKECIQNNIDALSDICNRLNTPGDRTPIVAAPLTSEVEISEKEADNLNLANYSGIPDIEGLLSQFSKELNDLTASLDPKTSSENPNTGTPTPPPAQVDIAVPQSDSAPLEEEPLPSTEELLNELDQLCGLDTVKKDVHSLINLVKVRKLREESGLPAPPLSLHMVFMGNPGTGKTTVARLLSKIYRSIGILSKGQLVEVDRSGLVAGYVGQTALKTSEVVKSAIGGVLFIDEAYALAPQDSSGNDFGKEAIEVVLKSMEDNRSDLIVIVAGYTDLMDNFLHSNPGLDSRFNKRLFFDDYNGDQLMEIFCSLCKKNSYTLSEEASLKAAARFSAMYENRDENFGNARDVRNVFEKAVSQQANRISGMESPTKEDLITFLPEDLEST